MKTFLIFFVLLFSFNLYSGEVILNCECDIVETYFYQTERDKFYKNTDGQYVEQDEGALTLISSINTEMKINKPNPWSYDCSLTRQDLNNTIVINVDENKITHNYFDTFWNEDKSSHYEILKITENEILGVTIHKSKIENVLEWSLAEKESIITMSVNRSTARAINSFGPVIEQGFVDYKIYKNHYSCEVAEKLF